MPAIITTNLVKRYKDLTAVDKLNLEIMQGDLLESIQASSYLNY